MSVSLDHGEYALLGLGSNLGERDATLKSAVAALRATPGIEVLAVSGFIETEPVGRTDQPRFLNGAARLRTMLSPRDLLQRCLAIEHAHGRDRQAGAVNAAGGRWGPRTLDIDLLLFGERIIDEPGLRVPHPRLHERLFALTPAAQIAGEMVHPVLRKTVESLCREERFRAEAGRAHGGAGGV